MNDYEKIQKIRELYGKTSWKIFAIQTDTTKTALDKVEPLLALISDFFKSLEMILEEAILHV